jgi:DnaJ-class molecular chaperone
MKTRRAEGELKMKIPKKYIAKKIFLVDKKCVACNGSGYYDTTNSPACSACNGTGKES